MFISLPAALQIINDALFEGCTNLRSITIKENVAHIGTTAFKDCTSLNKIIVERGQDGSGDMTVLGNNALQNTVALVRIEVPSVCVDEYKTAENWKYYADKIVAV